MSSLLNNSGHWQQRARETRRLADSVDDQEAKQTLLKIAEEYERLARRAASRDGRDDRDDRDERDSNGHTA